MTHVEASPGDEGEQRSAMLALDLDFGEDAIEILYCLCG